MGDIVKFDIINATSLGLQKDDEIKLNYDDIGPNKLFYDIIYNPGKTKFLLKGKNSAPNWKWKNNVCLSAQSSFEFG